MNLQSQAVSDALALFPVYPPQWVTPVQPPSIAHGGISRSAFTPQGLEVIIEPITGLQSWVMAAFDVVTLYVNNVRTNVSKTITPGEEGNRFLLYLPETWFINGVNGVFYRVTRVSGNTDDSPTLQLLYHNPAPTITVSHPPSIGPGQPAVITLTVSYARPYDTVTLTIGTWSITFTNPDPTKPITHTLTAAELQQIGDGTHPVSARVIDQLTNSNVSATTSITITANQKVYNPPIIFEAEPGKVLDVPELKGKDATIHALTWTGMVDGQPCWLKLLGFKADGSPHDLQLWNGLPAQTNPTWISQGKYPQPVLNSYLVQLGDGMTLTVQFWVSEDKSNNFATATKFADQVYTVKAEALIDPGADKTLNLTDVIFAEGRLPAYFPASATYTQLATGGVHPITYRSLNTAIATVTPQGGTVTCRANGTTQIVATDAKDTTASYTLTVRGIKTFLRNDTTLRSWTDGHNYCSARGGRLPSYDEAMIFYRIYAKENQDVAALLGWPNIQSHPHIWFGIWLNGQRGIYHVVLTYPSGGGPETTGVRPTLCLIG